MFAKRRHKTRSARSFLPLVMVLAFLSPALGAEVRVNVSGDNVFVTEDAQGYARFSGPDLRYLSETGEPAVPYRMVTVLLPPAADVSSISARIEEAAFEEIPGRWNVRPVGLPASWDGTKVVTVWPEGKTIVGGRDISVYDSDALFPGQVIGELTSGSMRGWKLASVPVDLFRYNPVRMMLLRLSGGEVCFSYSERKMAAANRNAASDRIASENIKDIAANYDSAAPLYADGQKSGPGPGGTTYVILTTSAIQSALTNLDSFTINKQARGFTVQVVTEGDWGGGTGNTAAENIRSWLAANYITSNIEYVLLIGNPHPDSGDVPMKYCYPYSGSCPTDYYYCDLTGNWDLNDNGQYGQTSDFGAGGVDRNWDVIVGRIPYYGSIDEVDAVLSKTIDYENTPTTDASWRHNVLLPMVAFSGSCLMYELGEELKDDALTPKGWPYHRIYQSDYGLSPPPETVGTSVENTTNTWNASPFGAVIWATHGGTTHATAIMDLDHAATLDDGYPSFTYQGSCNNSWPETTNNLAYMILQNGGIATVGATRTSWYTYPATSYKGTGSIGGVGYEYGYRLTADDMSCGYSLCNLKQDVHYGYSWCWQNYIVFNIYGDPSLGLLTTLVDDDSDSMPDWWEITHFGDISQAAGDDYDSDNLTNLDEYGQGTDPDNHDCDGDDLNDGDEVHTHGTDPLNDDTDGDGLGDGDEVNTHGSDPVEADSDGDGLHDYEEVITYGTDPTDMNSDDDSWCDVLEISGGSNPNDPNDPPPGSAPDMLRISFQPAGSVRPENYAPSSDSGYSTDLGYGWR